MREHFYTYPHVVELRNPRDRSATAAEARVRVAPPAAPARARLVTRPAARTSEVSAQW